MAHNATTGQVLNHRPTMTKIARTTPQALPTVRAGADCRATLPHSAPCFAMRADAQAQVLVAKRRTAVALVAGPARWTWPLPMSRGRVRRN